ncbi:MAG: S41 family peptidase, partial [Planctomycetaceae bacterium]
IFDLRGNPGGLLTAAVEVLDRFIDSGVLVSTRGRSADQNWTYSAHRSGTHQLPLVLLVDADSASASEIVAGAVRDYRRGTIVGRKTYGKWSVQSIFTIRGATGLKLTTARFYSPHNHTFGDVGIKPDVVVALPETHETLYRGAFDTPDPATDADLRAGMDVLRQAVTRR